MYVIFFLYIHSLSHSLTHPPTHSLTHSLTRYAALAGELKGLFFKDGGPIWGVQVDNETPDWHYLLALRDAALAVGMTPVHMPMQTASHLARVDLV